MSVVSYYKRAEPVLEAGGIRLVHMGAVTRAWVVPYGPTIPAHHMAFVRERLEELWVRSRRWALTNKYTTVDKALQELVFKFETKFGKSNLTGWRLNQLYDDQIIDLLNDDEY